MMLAIFNLPISADNKTVRVRMKDTSACLALNDSSSYIVPVVVGVNGGPKYNSIVLKPICDSLFVTIDHIDVDGSCMPMSMADNKIVGVSVEETNHDGLIGIIYFKISRDVPVGVPIHVFIEAEASGIESGEVKCHSDLITIKVHERTIIHQDRVEPTCEECGLTSGDYCEECRKPYDHLPEIIPPTGHKDDGRDGECDICGKCLADINKDGAVNAKDLTRIMKYLAGYTIDEHEPTIYTTDVNCDGIFNAKDLTRLMKIISR